MVIETDKDQGLMLEYFVPISESATVDGDFTIGGVAINETTTSNGHKFIAEELSKSAHTLIDVPLLKDHENRVDNIVGRVKSAHFDESAKNIPFRAIVKDEKMKQMIKDKLINSVSVGAHVLPQDVEEGEDGDIIPHNITFKELSLVAVGADPQATFNVALNNAWSGFKSNSNEKIKSVEREVKEMAEEKEDKPQEAEEVKAEEVEAKVEAEEVEAPEEAKEDLSDKILTMLQNMDKRLAKIECSDVDEAKPEPVEKEEEAKAEPEEEEEEAPEVEEKAGYNLVAGHGSFTVDRKDYRQRLTA